MEKPRNIRPMIKPAWTNGSQTKKKNNNKYFKAANQYQNKKQFLQDKNVVLDFQYIIIARYYVKRANLSERSQPGQITYSQPLEIV